MIGLVLSHMILKGLVLRLRTDRKNKLALDDFVLRLNKSVCETSQRLALNNKLDRQTIEELILNLTVVLELFKFDRNLRIRNLLRMERLGKYLVLRVQRSKSEEQPLLVWQMLRCERQLL